MAKRIWTGFVVVFMTTQIIEGIVNFYLLDPLYSSSSYMWRPIAEAKLWMLPFTGMFFSFFFVYIFSKGYEGKGLAEGIRYGFYVSLMVVLPHAYGTYALMQIPYSLALLWFVYGAVEYVIAGALLSLAFRQQSIPPSPAP
jgi:hypothetical protein